MPRIIPKDLVLPKAARNALGSPKIGIVHEVEVEVWSCWITRMADIGQRLTWENLVAWRHLDRANLSMAEEGIPIGRLNDDVIANQWPEVRSPLEFESQGVLEKYGKISCEVDGISLRPAVLGMDNGSSDRGIDRLPPAIAILQSHAEDKVVEQTVSLEAHSSGLWGCAYEVIGVPLAERISSMAWNLLARSVGGHPFTPEGKVYDGRSGHEGTPFLCDV